MPRINRAGRLSPLRAVALAVSLAGIAMRIGGNGIETSVEKLPGIACALAGAVCVALGTVLTKHFPLAMPPLSLAAWQIGLGCLPIAIVGLAVEQPRRPRLEPCSFPSSGCSRRRRCCMNRSGCARSRHW